MGDQAVQWLGKPAAASPTGGEVVREADCLTNGPGFESWVRHGCRADRPWLHQ